MVRLLSRLLVVGVLLVLTLVVLILAVGALLELSMEEKVLPMTLPLVVLELPLMVLHSMSLMVLPLMVSHSMSLVAAPEVGATPTAPGVAGSGCATGIARYGIVALPGILAASFG